MNLPREARWFFVNYLLLNACVFVLSVVQGVRLFASHGSVMGWPGSPIEQVFWYAVGSVFYTAAFFGIPALLVALLAWRLAIRVVGRPRTTAYLVAIAVVVAAALLIERADPVNLAILLVAALGFATIVRAPDSVSGRITRPGERTWRPG